MSSINICDGSLVDERRLEDMVKVFRPVITIVENDVANRNLSANWDGILSLHSSSTYLFVSVYLTTVEHKCVKYVQRKVGVVDCGVRTFLDLGTWRNHQISNVIKAAEYLICELHKPFTDDERSTYRSRPCPCCYYRKEENL